MPGAISHTYGPAPMAIQSFSKSTCSRSPQPLQRKDKSLYIIVGTSFIACTAQHFGCQAVQHNVMGVNIRLGRSLRPALLHHCSSALPSVSHTCTHHNNQRHTHHCCFESGTQGHIKRVPATGTYIPQSRRRRHVQVGRRCSIHPRPVACARRCMDNSHGSSQVNTTGLRQGTGTSCFMRGAAEARFEFTGSFSLPPPLPT
jgi:hypothetical protein